MAYRGSKIVPVRIPEQLLGEIQAAIARVEFSRDKGPHTMTSWILEACQQKLDHLARAKASKRSRVKK